jgi:hypothetical protein
MLKRKESRAKKVELGEAIKFTLLVTLEGELLD